MCPDRTRMSSGRDFFDSLFACWERCGRNEMHDLHDFSAVHGLQEAVFRGYHANHANHAKRSDHAGYRNHANHAKRSNHTGYIKPCKPCRPCRSCKSAENCAFPFQKLRSKGRAGPYGRPVVGWGRKKSSPFTLRLAVALSVTVRLRGLCHLPHRGRQEHARGCRLGGGKANLLTASPYHSFTGFDGGTLGSPCGGAGETPAGRRD